MGREDISKQMGIPKQMIAQIAKPLRNAGIIATKRGVGGGFSLNRKPEDISLADIFNAVDQPLLGRRLLLLAACNGDMPGQKVL